MALQLCFNYEDIFQLYNKMQNMLYFDSSLMHIIDIRDKDHFAKNHIKYAINIPMTDNNASNKRNIILSLKQIFERKQQIKDNYHNPIILNAWNDNETKIFDDNQVFDQDEEYFYIYHGCEDNNNKQILEFIQLLCTVITEQCNHINIILFRVLYVPFKQFHNVYPFLCSSLKENTDEKKQNTIISYPNSILDNYLYLGGASHASNYQIFQDLNITHCVNVTTHVKCHFKDKTPKIKYLNIKIDDMYYEKIDKYFETAHRFINNALYDIDSEFIDTNPFAMEQNDIALKRIKDRVVLVHCQGGVSRSASIVISYLMKTKNMKMMDAMDYVSDRRSVICPNHGFRKQLKQYETQLFGDENHQYVTSIVIPNKKKQCVIL
eukprot:244744_1